MKRLLLSAALLLGVAAPALAEKADSYKPTNISYGSMDIDDVKQVTILLGGVKLTRGTLTMTAERAYVKQTPEGYQQVTLFGDGKKATFRQKRDGAGDQWVEGDADRIEYEEQVELVKMFNKATIRRLEGGKQNDEVQGEFISYDSRKEFFSVRNTASGESKPGGGRGTMVIQPTRTEPPATPPAAQPTTPPAEKK
ncbi:MULTISPECIES: lipopolysaccharide transport periplasmic protein LptA [unclassified Duganella]|uniref:lipopolysaccharide transport periplasmic protein LptA n=1 Tax=unclassified Duganella TaxID=2636909 RepID=UPI00070191FE|nr:MULTISPECIES: lipopolysaccharide transport periplasmic protein LptA [unclassified Duganella]KQV44724.1 ABC transporter substrate-binding protein [Duganella sp. Root336D2]KRB83247.1 ABC transporter substrate-binding protein [Duganella sp. Root198D2]